MMTAGGYIIGDRGRPKLIRYTRQPVFLGHFTPITHENRLKIRFLVRDIVELSELTVNA